MHNLNAFLLCHVVKYALFVRTHTNMCVYNLYQRESKMNKQKGLGRWTIGAWTDRQRACSEAKRRHHHTCVAELPAPAEIMSF